MWRQKSTGIDIKQNNVTASKPDGTLYANSAVIRPIADRASREGDAIGRVRPFVPHRYGQLKTRSIVTDVAWSAYLSVGRKCEPYKN